MSHLEEHDCHMQVSEPTLYKPHCLYQTPQSEEEIPSFHQSELLSQCVPLKRFVPGYYLHCKQYTRKKSSKYSHKYDIKKFPLNFQEPINIREDLELYLTGTQVKEALAEDKQKPLIQHLDLSITALESFVQYVKSLQISQLAVSRVLNISYLLASTPSKTLKNFKSDSINLTTHFQQLEIQKDNKFIILQNLMEHCTEHKVFSKHLSTIINDYYMKKRNFYIAAKNFKSFLKDSNLSLFQMEKLHQQYDTILNNYQQSRLILDSELPKMINMKLQILQEGFHTIKEFHTNTDYTNEVLILFKLIGEEFGTQCTSIAENAVCNQPLPQSELCQKCKLNQIDRVV